MHLATMVGKAALPLPKRNRLALSALGWQRRLRATDCLHRFESSRPGRQTEFVQGARDLRRYPHSISICNRAFRATDALAVFGQRLLAHRLPEHPYTGRTHLNQANPTIALQVPAATAQSNRATPTRWHTTLLGWQRCPFHDSSYRLSRKEGP